MPKVQSSLKSKIIEICKKYPIFQEKKTYIAMFVPTKSTSIICMELMQPKVIWSQKT